ncbi:MAG: NADH-quinone oxidoreductase subunit N [Chloroflexota bacterium]
MNPNYNFNAGDLAAHVSAFGPELALVITFVVAILADIIMKRVKNVAAFVVLLGFIATGFVMASQSAADQSIFSQVLVADSFSMFFKWIILLSSGVVVLMSLASKELNTPGRSMGEYYSLICGMTFGMFLLSSSANLIMIYLALETMSLSSYVLSGFTKEVRRASEASLKYVLYGSLASGFMIYGMSLLYGLTGSLNIFEINSYLLSNPVQTVPLFVSGMMIIAGFAYKISAVPFHFWTPDVYEGSPVAVTAYLSVASKAAGFAVLVRFVKSAFIDPAVSTPELWNTLSTINWKYVIAILAVLSMSLGNLVALWQTNVKRILAYSSIAHAGYLLMGVAVMTNAGNFAILVYFFMYMLMNLGAFYVVQLVAGKIGSEELEDYNGLGYRAPALAAAMTIFLISLTGLPPTAGFIGKLYLFAAVINDPSWIWLAVVGVLNSVVSLFYYAKIFRNMYIRKPAEDAGKLSYGMTSQALMYALAALTLIFGIWYGPVAAWAEKASNVFIK